MKDINAAMWCMLGSQIPTILPFFRFDVVPGFQSSSILPFFPRVRFSPQRWEFIKENKKVRKQENKNLTMKAIKKTRENKNSTKKATKKKRKNFLFYLITFLVEFLFSFFLNRFLGRVLFFCFTCFLL